MLKKEEILKQIEVLKELEQRLIPLLNKEISSSLSFSGLNDLRRQEIIGNFQRIVLTQKKHLEVLEDIKNQIIKDKKDVY